MKVYIIYQNDGYNGTEVDRIFSSRRSAMDYVINTIYAGNSFYVGRSSEFLDGCADNLVVEFEVLP